MFDAMCLHSLSDCTNGPLQPDKHAHTPVIILLINVAQLAAAAGTARYVLTSSFHDDRALEMPHKLYMSTFSPEYLAAVPRCTRPAVDWLGPFVRDHIDLGEWADRSGQHFVQGRRLLEAAAVPKL